MLDHRSRWGWHRFHMLVLHQGDSWWVDRYAPLSIDHSQISSVFMLLNRPRFERVWVQQEIALANDNAVFICGHDSVMRHQFANAVFCLQTKRISYNWDQEAMFRARLGLALTIAQVAYRPGIARYSEILREQARNLKCFDPRRY